MKKFIYITIIFLIIATMGSVLDKYFVIQNFYSIIARIIIIIMCSIIIIKRKIHIIKGKFFSKYILIAILPMIINFVLMCGPVDKSVSNWIVISGIIRVVTTATWEELHFRAIGVDMLKNKKGKLTKEYAILLIFIFAFLHVINIILNPNQILVELFRIVLSLSIGAFFLAIYLKTGNILVSILSHFLLNYTTLFFNTFSSNPNSLGIIVYDVVYYIGIILYLCIAVNIIKQNKLVE